MDRGMCKWLILPIVLGFVGTSLQYEGWELRTDAEIYREMDDTYEQVGDMILEKSSGSNTRMASASHPNWPKGIVPYIVSENVTSDLKPVIEKAIKYVNKYTCLQLRPKTTSDEYWLRFLMKENASPNAVCSSYVGWLNKPDQGVFLGPKCFVGSMVHELLHAVGFFHEHTRNDRDKYIKVNTSNYADDVVARNYALDKTSCYPGGACKFNDYGVKYNYESIMHYCTFCGSKDPEYPVFTAMKGTDGIGDVSKIGQREGFSDGDWEMVNKKYECDTSKVPRPKPISAKPVVQTPEDEEDFTLPPFTLFPTPTLPVTTTTTQKPTTAPSNATFDGATPSKKPCKKKTR